MLVGPERTLCVCFWRTTSFRAGQGPSCTPLGLGQTRGGGADWTCLAATWSFSPPPRSWTWQGRWEVMLGRRHRDLTPPAHPPQGLFDNFLRLRLWDSSLGTVCTALDWLAFDDMLGRAAHRGQSFQLLRYLPFLPAAFHLLFASSRTPRVVFPSSQQEVCACPAHAGSGLGILGDQLCSPRPPGPEPDQPNAEPDPDAGVGHRAGHPQPGHTPGPGPGHALPASGHPDAQAAACECPPGRGGLGGWPACTERPCAAPAHR